MESKARMADKLPEKADFEKALNEWFLEAEKAENQFVDIRADDLHARIGDYPGPFHRMATCCEVMYEHYKPEVDRILQFPPKGKGASMEIRYALPRTQAIREENKNTSPRPESFTVKCEYCHGTGRDVRNLSAQQRSCPTPGCSADKKGVHLLVGKLEDYVSCRNCKGSGVIPDNEGTNRNNGTVFKPCPECDGTGIIKKDS
jgi:5-methylcytosine-specific restriction protein A